MTDFEKTFNNAATDYDKSRPMYTKELYDDIFRYKSINSESRVLEIGMGTGKATLPVLENQCHFTGIEPGENLAKLANERFKSYKNFHLYTQTLQDFECSDGVFDLIYAATAFHWIPEEYGYRRVYNLLKCGGAFARFAYHAGVDKGRMELTWEIQELYRRYMNRAGRPKEYSDEDAGKLAEIAANYGFTDIRHKLYHVTKDFTADEYMELLRTYPNHMALEDTKRKELFKGIYDAINRHGGTMTVYYVMDLELARKC